MKLKSAILGATMLATVACSDRTYKAQPGFKTKTPQADTIAGTGKPNEKPNDCNSVFNGPVLVRDKTSATLAAPLPVSVTISSIRMSDLPGYDKQAADLQVTFDGNDTRRVLLNEQNQSVPITYGKYVFTFSLDGVVMVERTLAFDEMVGHIVSVCVRLLEEPKPPEPEPPKTDPKPEPPKPKPQLPRSVPQACKPCATCQPVNVTVSPVITNNNGDGSVTVNRQGEEGKGDATQAPATQ